MLNESQNVEYKEIWRDEYLKWICGFANAQGGRIYIGVNDKKEVVGVDDSKRLMEDIPNKVVMSMGIKVDVNLLASAQHEHIEIVVQPSNMPISYKGKYYYRMGSTMQELTGTALQDFIMQKMGRSWDDVPIEHATLDDIDRQAIDYFIMKSVDAGRMNPDIRHDTTEKILRGLYLLDERTGRLKTAAILLFGKDPLRYFTCVRFRIGRFGASESDLITQDEVEGNILQMADRVMTLLRSKYLTAPIRYEGMQRIEELEIPDSALRELLYNAIVHKLYQGVDIQMKVYDDRLVLWNEGELPQGYTVDTLLGEHSSRPRNKNIANVFYLSGFIESWGRGFDKVRKGFAAKGLPMPTLESKFGGLLVTIQRPVEGTSKGTSKGASKGTSNSTSNSTSNPVITEQVKRLLEILDGDMSIRAMMEELNFSSRDKFIANYLNPATSAGLVEMTQPDSPKSPTQKYRLTETGKTLRRGIPF